jgi:oligo-1,6-glucosidase
VRAAQGSTDLPQSDVAWWQSAVVYQIYPRSFADSNGDGVGDLPGVLAHLDYIADLGIDVIWLSPVYRSPQDDNGYDISDYQDIDPLFGTLDDLDKLIDAVHERGMKLVMDLVVNHTSDEHPWFVQSRRSRSGPKADWYFWRDAKPGTVAGQPGSEPNNWGAAFSGSAWKWDPERGQFYLHLFSAKQPDLNWDNPEVRGAIFAMMNWWLDRGIDGFRMDVINFISKDPALPDGSVTGSGFGDGFPHFSSGPQLRAFLAEMRLQVFDSRPHKYLTVGEMPGVTPEQAREFTDRATGHLAMVFQFEHVALDHDGDKWTPRKVTVPDLRATLGRWQEALSDEGWNSLYWNNHDQPRVVSRVGDDAEYWYESATALATVLHLHRGTPYVYQGEELGMTNVPFDDIASFRDVESLNYYADQIGRLDADPAVVLDALRRSGRDNARTPMQWTGGAGAGFSTSTPWITPNPNHVWLNAESQRGDPNSIHAYYRALISLRHAEPVVVRGTFALLDVDAETVYAFRRRLDDQTMDVFANLSGADVQVEGADVGTEGIVIGNYPPARRRIGTLGPWEVRVFRR